jgi:uncharacterized protein (DUF849 family)
MGLATTASQMGGNLRVGLRDSLFLSRGKLVASNAEQVVKIRRIVEDLVCEVARAPWRPERCWASRGGTTPAFRPAARR